jgi:hypothetical protein
VTARPVPGTTVIAAALEGSRVGECEECGDLIWSIDGVEWEHMDTDSADCAEPAEEVEEVAPDGDETEAEAET